MSLASTLTRYIRHRTWDIPTFDVFGSKPSKMSNVGMSHVRCRMYRVRVEVLYGILSGILLTLSLPKPDLYPLAWVALIPLLCVILRDPNPRAVALVSYIAG